MYIYVFEEEREGGEGMRRGREEEREGGEGGRRRGKGER